MGKDGTVSDAETIIRRLRFSTLSLLPPGRLLNALVAALGLEVLSYWAWWNHVFARIMGHLRHGLKVNA